TVGATVDTRRHAPTGSPRRRVAGRDGTTEHHPARTRREGGAEPPNAAALPPRTDGHPIRRPDPRGRRPRRAGLHAGGAGRGGGMTKRPIPGWPRYVAAENGSIRNLRGDALAPHPNYHGYLLVSLYDDSGKRSRVYVHKLIAEAFHGPRPEGMQIR